MEKKARSLEAAERRVNRVLRALAAWGDLSTRQFSFDVEHVDTMIQRILDEINGQAGRFRHQGIFRFQGGNSHERTDDQAAGEDPAAE